ncbi:hypothetical protein [Methanosphaera sp. DEW79]|uniref:hypothetical protein n=1 Tax=Methanosphaera sp. DEW79 TaxID=1945576 RepID=UPI002579572B|nr:hypothetical protein [Methanosphaera sp. DEW79]
MIKIKNKNIFTLSLLVILLIGITGVNSHGVDVTADKMVICNDSNGQLVKDIADANEINISVYKFTSDDEVAHQLEHMLNNSNKNIIAVSYQKTAHDFLDKHQDVSDRLLIIDDVNNQSIQEGLIKVNNTKNTKNVSDFATPLTIGILVGAILGVGCGIFLMKRKQ